MLTSASVVQPAVFTPYGRRRLASRTPPNVHATGRKTAICTPKSQLSAWIGENTKTAVRNAATQAAGWGSCRPPSRHAHHALTEASAHIVNISYLRFQWVSHAFARNSRRGIRMRCSLCGLSSAASDTGPSWRLTSDAMYHSSQ